MPCSDSLAYQDSCNELYEKVNKLTRMLCGICGRVEAIDRKMVEQFINADFELARWWEEHKKADAERIAKAERRKKRKEVKRAALAKLTKEEMIALGLKDEND